MQLNPLNSYHKGKKRERSFSVYWPSTSSRSWPAFNIPFCFAICSIFAYCSAVKQTGIERSFMQYYNDSYFISFLLICFDRQDRFNGLVFEDIFTLATKFWTASYPYQHKLFLALKNVFSWTEFTFMNLLVFF